MHTMIARLQLLLGVVGWDCRKVIPAQHIEYHLINIAYLVVLMHTLIQFAEVYEHCQFICIYCSRKCVLSRGVVFGLFLSPAKHFTHLKMMFETSMPTSVAECEMYLPFNAAGFTRVVAHRPVSF